MGTRAGRRCCCAAAASPLHQILSLRERYAVTHFTRWISGCCGRKYFQRDLGSPLQKFSKVVSRSRPIGIGFQTQSVQTHGQRAGRPAGREDVARCFALAAWLDDNCVHHFEYHVASAIWQLIISSSGSRNSTSATSWRRTAAPPKRQNRPVDRDGAADARRRPRPVPRHLRVGKFSSRKCGF